VRRRTILAGGVAAVVVAVPVAAYGFLALTSADAPERAALDAAPEAAAGGDGRLDGTWTVAAVDTNFVGYRVRAAGGGGLATVGISPECE
jgi:hypothetical protein